MRKVILKSCKTGLKCRIIKKKGKYLVQYHGKGESSVGFDPWGHDEWSRWRTLDGCNWIGNPNGVSLRDGELKHLVVPSNSLNQAIEVLRKWEKGYGHRMRLAANTRRYGYIWQRCPEG